MYAVIFEVEPAPGRRQDYLDKAYKDDYYRRLDRQDELKRERERQEKIAEARKKGDTLAFLSATGGPDLSRRIPGARCPAKKLPAFPARLRPSRHMARRLRHG